MSWLIENWPFAVFVVAATCAAAVVSVRVERERDTTSARQAADEVEAARQDRVARNKLLKEQIARQRTNHELFERFKPMLRATFIDGRTLGKYQMHAITVDETFGQLSLVMEPADAGDVIEVGPSEFATFFNPVTV